MATFGTDGNVGIPTAFKFSYGGEDVDWGTTKLLHINDLSNTADPINQKRKISDLSVTFADIDGELWGSMGNGTGAFNKALNCDVYIGGAMGHVSSDIGVDFEKTSEAGAWTAPVHQGKIVEIQRKGRAVTLHSQNVMNLLKDLKWQCPVRTLPADTMVNFSGSMSELTAPSIGLELIGSCAYKVNDGTHHFKAVVHSDAIAMASYQGTGIYDTDAGTGILDFKPSGYTFVDTAFYTDYTPLEFKLTKDGSDWINIEWSGTADSTRPNIYPLKPIQLQGDPTAVLRHLLFGKMVSDYFDETTQMGTETFDPAQNIVAFQVFDQTFEPTTDEVYPHIEDLLKTEMALFYVSTTNRFQFEPYGPKDLDAVVDTLGSNEIIDASFENHIDDYFNRFQLNFDWDELNKNYTQTIGSKLDDWTGTEDRPLVLDSKWIKNGNQANVAMHRQMARFEKTSPHIKFTTSMKYAGMDLGSLVKLEDTDCELDGMIVQIIDYRKGFGNSNQVTFEALDGTSLWLQKGYAVWEGDETAPDMALNAAVSGTSLSGWGTMLNGDAGTPFTGDNHEVTNINSAKHGDWFVWW